MASTSNGTRTSDRSSSSSSLWDPTKKKDLHRWVTKSLEPICDADPPVLADYVIALLQHEGSELQIRKRLVAQLEEFLLDRTASFVDTLLSALRTKAYVPYVSSTSTSPPPASTSRSPNDTAIPIPLDALASSSHQSRGQKRSFDERDTDTDRNPPKAPRGHDQSTASRGRPRSLSNTASRDNRPSPSQENLKYKHDDRMDVEGSAAAPQTKPICRDYHHKGYCSRGALCNYSHGEDAVIPPPGMWMPDGTGFNPMMGFMPMMLPFGGMQFPLMDGGAYDPNQSHIDMRGPRSDIVNSAALLPNSDGFTSPTNQNEPILSEPPNQGPSANGRAPNQSYRNRGRGRGRSTPSGRPLSSDERTLVVEKIPAESLSLENVNQWFKKFGTVTNVAIDHKGFKALVSFQSHAEALRAWKSEDAVFGNRFVKVYWHRPLEGQGNVGKRALEASAPRLQNMEQSPTQPEPIADPAPDPQTIKPPLSMEARAALEKNMAEQKVLFSRLKSVEGDKKKAILARIRVLSEGMDDPLSVPPSTLLLDGTAGALAPTSEAPSNLQQLDKELDLRQAVQDLTRRAQDPNEDHDAIRGELEQLKAKAIAEGVNIGNERSTLSHDRSFPGRYPRRPYRARGRDHFAGRGIYRGRNGSSFKLDNRPKQLVVRGVPREDEQQLEQIREWHQATGQADTLTFEDNGDIIVQFRTRMAAEQALAMSASLKELIQDIKVFWPPQLTGASTTPEMTAGFGVAVPSDTGTGVGIDADTEDVGWGQGGDE